MPRISPCFRSRHVVLSLARYQKKKWRKGLGFLLALGHSLVPITPQVISISLNAECPVSAMCFCASFVPAPIQPHPGTSHRSTKSVVSV